MSMLLIFFACSSCLKGLKVFSIHGKMKEKRHKIFEKFRSAESGLIGFDNCLDQNCICKFYRCLGLHGCNGKRR